MKRFLIILVLAISSFACTPNQRAKQFGGSQTLNISRGNKVEMVTWKDDNMWILTRPMREDEKAETHTFFEQSSYGVLNGRITLVEQK